jgi:hypothetical protein
LRPGWSPAIVTSVKATVAAMVAQLVLASLMEMLLNCSVPNAMPGAERVSGTIPLAGPGELPGWSTEGEAQ